MNKRSNYKHGLSNTVEYAAWLNMVNRCINPNHPDYTNYGGRGIKVCKRWQGKEGLINFTKDMGNRPSPEHSLDRINNDGNYEPKNCRWATQNIQINNRRKYQFKKNQSDKIKPQKRKNGNLLVIRRNADLNKRIDYLLSKKTVLKNNSDVVRYSIIETSKALGYNG